MGIRVYVVVCHDRHSNDGISVHLTLDAAMATMLPEISDGRMFWCSVGINEGSCTLHRRAPRASEK